MSNEALQVGKKALSYKDVTVKQVENRLVSSSQVLR